MSKTVEFWFDVGSPASYLAWTQLPSICSDAGAALSYKPMLLGGVFQATGNHSPATIPAKGKYMFEDLTLFAQRYGVPFRNNPHFPVNTLMLMRGAAGLQAQQPARLLPYLDAVFRAMWVDTLDMNDPAIVGKVLHKAGFDPQALLALTQDAQVKEQLKTVTAEAVSRGVFGAPTMFVGSRMFWGQDRLDFVKEALQ
ncbi:2-hydroxychromene-2-carboxylate isomerase [Variovorax sp. VNK109]|uniref:2-hydroxychromene-2-carboxylate isomerase n=1 Tax=Variovorax sp. VNK109 TaxID=3400919 RepID=UPI003C0B8AF0